MALQSNAALLDELMGKNRNLAPGASIRDARFDDEDVCVYRKCLLNCFIALFLKYLI